MSRGSIWRSWSGTSGTTLTCVSSSGSSVSGVHYPADKDRAARGLSLVVNDSQPPHSAGSLHTDNDPHIPSVVATYPTADWHERETYDMFGIIFDGHPALTRILIPTTGGAFTPQRKDYPLGGVPVEYKGATIAPPDQRRSHHEHDRRADRRSRCGPNGGSLRRRPPTPQRVTSTLSPDRTGTSIVSEQAERVTSASWSTWVPSTHPPTVYSGLILELEGESVVEPHCGIGYLHTGIEKNMEFRNWTQGVTFARGWITFRPSTRRPPTAWASSGCSTSRPNLRRPMSFGC